MARLAGGEDEGYFGIRELRVRILPWRKPCSSNWIEHRKKYRVVLFPGDVSETNPME
jgi:hypothetical protein